MIYNRIFELAHQQDDIYICACSCMIMMGEVNPFGFQYKKKIIIYTPERLLIILKNRLMNILTFVIQV
jgi:hypothetical protein